MRKKNSFRVFSIVAVILILMSLSGAVYAQARIDEITSGVVQVRVETQGGATVLNRTGFVIGTKPPFQYVATTSDIADRATGTNRIRIFRSRDDNYPAEIFIRLQASRIVVLRIDPDHLLYPYEPIALGKRDMITQGEDVYAIGFRANAPTARSTDASVTKSVFSRVNVTGGVYFFVMEEGIRIDAGMAGGPLVNQDGVVIGMNVFNAGNTGISGGTDIDALIDALEARGIDFIKAGEARPDAPSETVEETRPPEPKPLNQVGGVRLSEEGMLNWDAVPNATGYEVAVYKDGMPVYSGYTDAGRTNASIVNIIETNGAGSYSAQVKALGQGDFVDGPMSSSSNIIVHKEGINPLFLAIGAGAVALIAAVGLMVVRGAKKTAPAGAVSSVSTQKIAPPVTQAKPEPAAAPVTKAKPSAPRASIKGISGHFSGQTIELVENQLVIGRDPRLAQLVYPQSNDDISRKHLTIRFDEKTNKFILEDSSSNGTFLSSNQRLESGKPYYLNAGDRFYVVDPKDVFELKLG